MDSQGNGTSLLLILFYCVVGFFYIYCTWRLYEKANQPGWTSIIPVLSTYIQLVIIGRPWWWLLLMLVPFVDIVIGIIIVFELGYVFGKDTAFGFGLLFLPFIFIPILALGDSTYRGKLTHAA